MDFRKRLHLRPVPTRGPLQAAAEIDEADAPRGVTPPTYRGGSGRFLTDVIVELEYVERDRVEAAVAAARAGGTTPELVLLEQGALTSDQLARATAERFGLDHLDLNIFPVDMAAANLVSSSAAKRYDALPVAFADGGTLIVAMADPANVLAVDDIGIMTGHQVRPVVASREDIRAARQPPVGLRRRRGRGGGGGGAGPHRDHRPSRVRRRRAGHQARALDHRPGRRAGRLRHPLRARGQGGMRVRYRIDGVLSASATIPRRMVAGTVSRIKIMADLDIAEKRRAPGRARRAHGRGPARRHPRGDAAQRARRVGRHAHPRQGRRRSSTSTSSGCSSTSASASRPPSARPTARCW